MLCVPDNEATKYMFRLRTKYKHPKRVMFTKSQDEYKHSVPAHKLDELIKLYGEDHCGVGETLYGRARHLQSVVAS